MRTQAPSSASASPPAHASAPDAAKGRARAFSIPAFREASERVSSCGPPGWTLQYVGIPFRSHGRDRSGCDCYGLVRLVLAEQFAVAVPSYAGDYPDALECAEVAALICRCLFPALPGEGGLWRAVANPGPATVILLRIAGEPWHVGLVVVERWFLHVRPGTDSCLERYDSIRWRRRIAGFYRYAG